MTDIAKLLQEPNQTPSRDFSRTINRTLFFSSFYWTMKSRADAGPGNLASFSFFVSLFLQACASLTCTCRRTCLHVENTGWCPAWTHLWCPGFGVTRTLKVYTRRPELPGLKGKTEQKLRILSRVVACPLLVNKQNSWSNRYSSLLSLFQNMDNPAC